MFAATSGHSGVDRILRNLVPEFTKRGVLTDILKVEGHGPHFDQLPDGARLVELGSRHSGTSLIPLIKYLRKHRPNALLSDKERVNRTALWACRLAKVNTHHVVRFGTTMSINLARKSRWEQRMQTFSLRRFYKRAKAIIVPSHGVKHDLVEHFSLSPDNIHVIHNPVLTADFFQRAQESIHWPWDNDDKTIPVIIGVGDQSPRKDFATLMRSFALLRQQRPCRLLLVGDGEEHAYLKSLAVELRVNDDVAFTGFVANPYPFIKKANVLALTSKHEGMGIVLAEALALGVQVVSTDSPSGPREVLQNGRAGFLAPVADVGGIATSLTTALDKPIDPEILYTAASRYSAEHSAEHYLRVLGLE
ncbi:glycosyltransferase [Alkalilimnicola ehrlichii]|uniref:glycosyltransferase n=1 Tax=Alkalilimnicola ehrlichii TaxID=351052 RepID=UPI00384F741B